MELQNEPTAAGLPFRLRIGVTGHRSLPTPTAVRSAVDRLVKEMVAQLAAKGGVPVSVAAVSSLADGADRLVAEAIRGIDGATLEVVLPLLEDDYMADFDGASQEEFARLLAAADVVVLASTTEQRPYAYAEAGRQVVDRCDVLIAVWDGQPKRGIGGTAEIVEYARQEGVATIVIDSATGSAPAAQVPIPDTVWAMLDSFRELDLVALDGDEVALGTALIDPAGVVSPGLAPHVASCVRWSGPYFARADAAALRCQSRYFRLADAVIILSALSIALLAFHIVFAPDHNWLALIEAGMLLIVLAIVVTGRRSHVHSRWLSFRSLAERVRSASYLAAAGVRRADAVAWEESPHESNIWVTRALDEMWREAPTPFPPATVHTDSVRTLLTDAWVEGQIGYHLKTAARHGRIERRLNIAIAALFAVTLIAAIVHGFEIGHHSQIGSVEISDIAVFLALALPAAAAAVGGIQLERELTRTSKRSRGIAVRLTALQRRLKAEPDLQRLRTIAIEVDDVLADEGRDWFRFRSTHDLELKA